MSSYHSYPKVWNLGHGAVREIFADEVHAEEKIDGSQFSFGLIDGVLRCRSKGQELNMDAPEKMFQLAVDTVKRLEPLLSPGWTYRAEYLSKPKHNVLAYTRVPKGNLIIFDINVDEKQYLSYEEKVEEATRLGLEVVPILYQGSVDDPQSVTKLLDTESVLGGQKIEGIVFKNYLRFGPDKKALLAKHVSEAFKEKHKSDWKVSNSGQKDIVELMIQSYRTEVRWHKARQHLREAGQLTDSPKDIGLLIREAQADAKVELQDEIKEQLFNWAWSKIERAIIYGLPEWYKGQLMEKQFEDNKESDEKNSL